ncbi:MAG: ABC transporter permease subunit [Clostridiales bacterium]|nr:ABC transporter permease subunit [Clostridiales bacterium]
MLLPIAYILVFAYYPMYGAQIAFKKFNAAAGILGSPWVGLENFFRFFRTYRGLEIVFNTISISLYGLAVGFPIPIALAVMLNYTGNTAFKKFVQMVTYAPYFISVVVMCGMVLQFLAPRTGLLNNIRGLFGLEDLNFMGNPDWFSSIYVWSGVWQGMGWGAIIYISALAGVNPEMHESAIIDGASKLRRIWHIDLPTIQPIIAIQLILSAGGILNTGYEKILLLQNSLNSRSSEVIQTLVYRTGIAAALIPDVSYSTAIGLMVSVINFIILIAVNQLVKKLGSTSLW